MHLAAKIGIGAVVAGGIAYGLAQCSGSERRDIAPTAAPAPVDDGTGPRFARGWWSEAEPCPDGAVLGGAAPPDGREIWCELPDGTRHGPHTAWWPNGRTHFARSYAHGHLDGELMKWRPSGQRWQAGHYRDGVRTGRWVEWGKPGDAKVTDYD